MDAVEYIGQAAECGRKAARCRWRRDESGARWEHDAAQRLFGLFDGEHRRALEGAYRAAYSTEWERHDHGCRPN